MKRFFQIFLLIICVIILFEKDRIKQYFVEQHYYSSLLNHNVIKHCYSPQNDLIEIFSQEGLDYYNYDQKITKDSLLKLQNLNTTTEKSFKIPTIHHKIHFFPEDSNEKLDTFYLEEFKLNFSNFNKLKSTWKYIIWTNKPELFSEISDIENLEIKNVEEFENHPYYNMLSDMLLKAKKVRTYLGKASNLLRLMALQKFGGVYSDNDFEIYNPPELVNLIKTFDFIGVRTTAQKESYYSNSFIASTANHPIIKDALERSMRNYHLDIKDFSIPEYLKYPCSLTDKMIMGSDALLTLSYFTNNNLRGNSDIILPSWMLINQEFARLKNNNCKLSKITSEFFNSGTTNLPSLLDKFINDPKWKTKQYNCNNDINRQNIYYNMKYHDSFNIIGADPACATWDSEGYNKKYLYFNYPWEWKIISENREPQISRTCQ